MAAERWTGRSSGLKHADDGLSGVLVPGPLPDGPTGAAGGSSLPVVWRVRT